MLFLYESVIFDQKKTWGETSFFRARERFGRGRKIKNLLKIVSRGADLGFLKNRPKNASIKNMTIFYIENIYIEIMLKHYFYNKKV